MNEPITLDTLALQLDDMLRQQCAQRGVEYTDVRGILLLKWFANSSEDAADPVRAILDRVYACEQSNDETGRRDASLEWLRTVHDVGLGDTVRLGCGRTARTVVLEDFLIKVSNTGQSVSVVTIHGPCTSPKRETLREFFQFIDDPIVKVVKEPA